MAKDGPDHVRVQKHGIRTTAETQDELNEEAFAEAQAEGHKRNEGRTTGAGPNPYGIDTSRKQAGEDAIKQLLKDRDDNELDNSLLSEQALASYQASSRESEASDAEVQTLGATVTDTPQKIVEKPDRVDAQDKAVLPRIQDKHQAAIDEDENNTDYRVVAAHQEAVEESDDPLRADNNAGPGAPPVHGEGSGH